MPRNYFELFQTLLEFFIFVIDSQVHSLTHYREVNKNPLGQVLSNLIHRQIVVKISLPGMKVWGQLAYPEEEV
jgi:hypothetical protein